MNTNKRSTQRQVSALIRKSLILGFFIIVSSSSIGQVLVIFDHFPQSVQLIQRNNSNLAEVKIEGKVYTENQTDISLLVYKNKTPFFYKKQKLQYANQPLTASFSFAPIINAELSEYDFKVYAFRNKDSVLVKEANEVVCGDNIIIYGQSNALAEPGEELIKFKDEFKYGRSILSDLAKNEHTWVITKKWNHGAAGLIGLQIQKQLIDKYKIPIGILNGSVGNKSIEELSFRDEANHDNPNTIYGRLLRRAKGTGIDRTVKMIVWRQGESEATDPGYKGDYDKKFEKFRKQLYEDYPALRKIYTYQNNIYFGSNTQAGNLREYQRNINAIYKDCEAISTFGTVTFDGLHYKYEGYLQNGDDVSRLIARDFHASADTIEINSPNIKYAYFNKNKDSLILEFDKNQTMFFPKDEPKKTPNAPSINVKDYIYLDGEAGNIESGIGKDNYIILKLKKPSAAKKITYTPDNYTNDFITVLPGLTQIKNSRGLMALTFKDFPITEQIIPEKEEEKITLSGDWDSVSLKRIYLAWSPILSPGSTYVIEKAQFQPNLFYQIATTTDNTFTDNKVKKGVVYYYRISRKGLHLFSPYSNIIEVVYRNSTNAEVFTPNNEDLIIYPNPIQRNEPLKLAALFESQIVELRIVSATGKIVFKKSNPEPTSTIPTNDLPEGHYIIEAILADNTKLFKKFVVQ